MILRQNPTNPCQLQQSQDGGDTWTLAYDYSICSQVITVPAPFPDSTTGAEDAAANIVHNLFEKLAELLNANDCGNKEQFILDATAWIRTFEPSFTAPAYLEALYNVWCETAEGERDEYLQDCVYEDHFNDMTECANDEGGLDFLDCWNEMLTNWLNETSSDLMEALNRLASALTGNGYQNMAGYGGAGGGSSFGAACTEWMQEFSFLENMDTWTIYVDGSGTQCVQQDGLGARSNIVSGGSNRLHIYRDLNMIWFTRIEVDYTRFNAPTGSYDLQFIDEATLSNHFYANSLGTGGGEATAVWTSGFADTGQINIALLWIENSFTEYLYVRKIRFYGNGDNPFA